MSCWVGVDVGGRRKRFDVAVIDERKLVCLERRLDHRAVIQRARTHRPVVVAVDSPCCAAPEHESSRTGERDLNRAVCGIRWTPDAERLRANETYYEWIREGLALYEMLASEDVTVIEVFPTASWTRWLGERSPRRRAKWTREGIDVLALEGLPARTNQDQRDAIAAAITARQHTRGETEPFGEIVVPTRLP